MRFETEGTASVALERMKQECEGKVSVNGEEVEPSILEGSFCYYACQNTLQYGYLESDLTL